jgi:hypothetical protein
VTSDGLRIKAAASSAQIVMNGNLVPPDFGEARLYLDQKATITRTGGYE